MEGAGLLNLVTHLTTDTADSGGIDVIMNYIIAMSYQPLLSQICSFRSASAVKQVRYTAAFHISLIPPKSPHLTDNARGHHLGSLGVGHGVGRGFGQGVGWGFGWGSNSGRIW